MLPAIKIFTTEPSASDDVRRTRVTELDVLRLAFSRCCGKSATQISSLSTRSVYIALLLSPPSEQSEWRRYYFRCMCVCVCVSVRSGPVNYSPKMVKATDFKFDVRVFL